MWEVEAVLDVSSNSLEMDDEVDESRGDVVVDESHVDGKAESVDCIEFTSEVSVLEVGSSIDELESYEE